MERRGEGGRARQEEEGGLGREETGGGGRKGGRQEGEKEMGEEKGRQGGERGGDKEESLHSQRPCPPLLTHQEELHCFLPPHRDMEPWLPKVAVLMCLQGNTT